MVCPNSYYADSDQTCKRNTNCHPFCSYCTSDPLNCLSCTSHPGIRQFGTSCVCMTIEGYNVFKDVLGKDHCLKCHPLCETCFNSSEDKCFTCKSTKKAVFSYPSSCVCPTRYYYDSELSDCAPCHHLCKNCSGPGNSQCIGCNNSAYSVEGNSALCVEDCYTLSSRYASNRICRLCNPECLTCNGPTNSNCLYCSLSTKVQYKGKCQDDCPLYFVALSGICLPCHSSCSTCNNTASNGCKSCKDGLLLHERTCISKCPAITYPSDGVCTKCEGSCLTCLTKTKCLSCTESHYLIPEQNACLKSCIGSFYGDDKTRTCLRCDISCIDCRGPTNKDCITCNYLQGYSRSGEGIVTCAKLLCSYGSFPFIDKIKKVVRCEKCDPACATCNDFGKESCIICNKGFITMPSPKSQANTKCMSCSEFDPGLRNPKGIETGCQAICGDGLRRGSEECDDGNAKDGDGCSSKCKVEQNFICNYIEGKGEFCISTLPVVANVQSVDANNAITIVFNKKVKPQLSPAKFEEKIKVNLVHADSSCSLKWNLSNPQKLSTYFSRLIISTNISCTIKGYEEKAKISFNTPIKDEYNNTLTNPSLEAKLNKKTYISMEEKAAVDSGGSGMSISAFVTFGISVIPALLQSVAIGQFWSFVNMVQILYYIPAMKILLPSNFELLLTQYLKFAQISIPFDLMPSWVPNPKFFILNLYVTSMSLDFSKCGLESFSFIFNFAEQLVTWILILGAYIALSFLNWIRPKDRFMFIEKMKKDYTYNIVIRVLLETYLHMSICSIVNINEKIDRSFFGYMSLVLAVVAFVLALGFLVISLRLLEKSETKLDSEKFKDKYGTLTEGLKTTGSSFEKGYNPIYMLRRIFFAIVLVFLIDMPTIQLILYISLAFLPMFVYLITCKPFLSKFENYINIINEFILLAIFLMLMIVNMDYLNEYYTSIAGWVMISLVGLSLIITWVALAPTLWSSFRIMIKDARAWCSTPQEEQVKISVISAVTNTTAQNTAKRRVTKRVKKDPTDAKLRTDQGRSISAEDQSLEQREDTKKDEKSKEITSNTKIIIQSKEEMKKVNENHIKTKRPVKKKKKASKSKKAKVDNTEVNPAIHEQQESDNKEAPTEFIEVSFRNDVSTKKDDMQKHQDEKKPGNIHKK